MIKQNRRRRKGAEAPGRVRASRRVPRQGKAETGLLSCECFSRPGSVMTKQHRLHKKKRGTMAGLAVVPLASGRGYLPGDGLRCFLYAVGVSWYCLRKVAENCSGVE